MNIQDYHVFRRDPCLDEERRGGGVAMYVYQRLQVKRRTDLETADIECMWLLIRPVRLPSSVTTLIFGTLYHPPWANEKALQQKVLNYLISTLDTLKAASPQMGLVLCGDFNKLPIKMLKKKCYPEIKLVVKDSTRGNSILDLIITNLHSYQKTPTVLAPVGSSDHNCVMFSPKEEQQKA